MGKNDDEDNKGEGKWRQTLREGCEGEPRFQDISKYKEGGGRMRRNTRASTMDNGE